MSELGRKKQAVICITVLLNVVLMFCVVFSVLTALRNAQDITFNQNIENVLTLTNASANKVELETKHHAMELATASSYVNNYNGVGMTADEMTEYFSALYSDNETYSWQLVDNAPMDNSASSPGFYAVCLNYDCPAFVYRTLAYPSLAKIFGTSNESTMGELR